MNPEPNPRVGAFPETADYMLSTVIPVRGCQYQCGRALDIILVENIAEQQDRARTAEN